MKFPTLCLSFVNVWVGMASPHKLNSCQNLNLLKQIILQTNKANIHSHVLFLVTSELKTYSPTCIPQFKKKLT